MIPFTKMFTKEEILKYSKFWQPLTSFTFVAITLSIIGALIIAAMITHAVGWHKGYDRGFETGMTIQEGTSERLCNERIEKGLIK